MKTIAVLALFAAFATIGIAGQDKSEKRLPITFTGGFELDPRDHGRPVSLIAPALGVENQIFRDAFSKVTPAQNGKPDRDLAQRNKAALLGALSKYGVTNERLDEVSDHYRYRQQEGERWPTKPAKAFAVVKDGKIIRIDLTDPGYGYSSTPKATLPDMKDTKLKTTTTFSKDFTKNGSIKKVELEK